MLQWLLRSRRGRTPIGVSSIPSDAAIDCIAPNWPRQWRRSRTTATRVTVGANSLRTSSRFATVAYSNGVNPVALPPGRARLFTKPAPTGSGTYTNTMGTVRVACSKGPTVALPGPRITSGASCSQLPSMVADAVRIARAPARHDLHFASVETAELL